jgi:hypothetical protein
MRMMRIARSASWSVPLLIAAAVSSAFAQSSTNFKLAPGVFGAGTSISSTNFKLNNDVGGARGRARASSANFDAIGGFVGGAFSPVATVTVPTLASPNFASIAFGVNASNNAVGAVLSEFGAYDNTLWRLGHFSPADSAYMEPGAGTGRSGGSLNLTTIAPGQGYWLTTKAATTANDAGLPAPATEFSIPLLGTNFPALSVARPAWNQIGNPFLFPVPANALKVTDGTIPNTFFLTSILNTLTDQTVKGWTGTAYADVTVLNGRTAYWVHKKVPGTVTLIIPYISSATGIPEPALAKPAGADWAVAITAHQGERECEPMMVGATSLAAGPESPLNASRAPAPPVGNYLSLHMPRTDWGYWNGDYVHEFKAQSSDMSWDFLASGGEAPGEMAFDFAGFDVPSGTRLWLTDLGTGTTRAVVPGETVTMAATAAPRQLRLQAVASGASGPQATIKADGFRMAYPNPFGATTGLAFALARGGDLKVEIYDVMGRRVRDLSRPGAGPGEHVLVWDGRDADGRSVANGIYFARYHAGEAAGVRRLVRVE